MSDILAEAPIRHPWPQPPAPGTALQVAEGVLWMRLPLPLRLDHVNCYALADGDGWTLIDAGYGDAPTLEAWEQLLTGPLAGRPVRQVIVTHFHPDHVGAAGWLCRRTGARLVMSRTEYLMSVLRKAGTAPDAALAETAFFRRHGADEAVLSTVRRREAAFRAAVTDLPLEVRLLRDGQSLRIGARTWRVILGGGHSPAQVVLVSDCGGLALSADQLIDRISPTIPSNYLEPEENPLGDYLDALERLRPLVPGDVLVLPGHKLPFIGAQARIDQLLAHHRRALAALHAACLDQPLAASRLIGVLYSRSLGPDGQALAISEIVSHLSWLKGAGLLEEAGTETGPIAWRGRGIFPGQGAAGSGL